MPNKAKSKRQFRLFKGIAEGNIEPKTGLSRETASEMLGNQSPKGLPEKKTAKQRPRGKAKPLPYRKA
jgi:hypothetical protein